MSYSQRKASMSLGNDTDHRPMRRDRAERHSRYPERKGGSDDDQTHGFVHDHLSVPKTLSELLT
jgi:hypothetical protein